MRRCGPGSVHEKGADAFTLSSTFRGYSSAVDPSLEAFEGDFGIEAFYGDGPDFLSIESAPEDEGMTMMAEGEMFSDAPVEGIPEGATR